MRRGLLFVPLLLATGIALAAEGPEAKQDASAKDASAKKEQAEAQKKEGPKTLEGMSILGNQEAPKSLVIVPWKSSELGNSLGLSTMFDDSRQPIDKEVFMRALSYYEIRSETTRPAQTAPAAHRSKP
jgi:hypothetical protein